jgi:hypothetical protein
MKRKILLILGSIEIWTCGLLLLLWISLSQDWSWVRGPDEWRWSRYSLPGQLRILGGLQSLRFLSVSGHRDRPGCWAGCGAYMEIASGFRELGPDTDILDHLAAAGRIGDCAWASGAPLAVPGSFGGSCRVAGCGDVDSPLDSASNGSAIMQLLVCGFFLRTVGTGLPYCETGRSEPPARSR